ncbi:MAG: DUF4202 domain-containing protein [Ilumatobacteraceae bacterium]
MRSLNPHLANAVAAIDAANADDPTVITVRGEPVPLALAHGRLAAEWVADLHPGADETWLIAARAHHLRRWEVPRTDYPAGKPGYLRWKRDQRQRHARDIAVLLTGVGYDEAVIERVQALVRRDNLSTDAGSQAIEDAACLVFLETQLAAVSLQLERDHLIDVLRKTARKISPSGAAAIARIPLASAERQLLADALG